MAIRAQTTPEHQLWRARTEGWRYDGRMATEGEVLELLCALVQVTKSEICVETGTFEGHGSRAISEGLRLNDKGHLWSVENDPGLARQLREAELDRTSFVEADSVEWSGSLDCPEEINFAWVDCHPDPAGRVEVFRNLHPKINGLIACHDSAFYREEDYLDRLTEIAGPPSLILPALNGFVAWQVD